MLDTLRNAWKIEDLRKKLLFTFFILMLTRIGSQIPVPFLDPSALTSMVSSTGGIFSYLDMLTGGAFSRSTLFALSISPYITASIVIQLLTVAIPYLENLAKEGEEGKRRINKITRYTTLALAFLQAFAYTMLLNNQGAIQSFEGWQYYFARIIIILCFTAGAMLIVFMGERIDAKGIGNGISMILFIGIVSRGGAVINTMIAYLKLAVEGATYYFFAVPFVIVLFLAVIAFIIVMTNAERRIPVQYAKRIVGSQHVRRSADHLCLDPACHPDHHQGLCPDFGYVLLRQVPEPLQLQHHLVWPVVLLPHHGIQLLLCGDSVQSH